MINTMEMNESRPHFTVICPGSPAGNYYEFVVGEDRFYSIASCIYLHSERLREDFRVGTYPAEWFTFRTFEDMKYINEGKINGRRILRVRFHEGGKIDVDTEKGVGGREHR